MNKKETRIGITFRKKTMTTLTRDSFRCFKQRQRMRQRKKKRKDTHRQGQKQRTKTWKVKQRRVKAEIEKREKEKERKEKNLLLNSIFCETKLYNLARFKIVQIRKILNCRY
jgi:hypothetical protein